MDENNLNIRKKTIDSLSIKNFRCFQNMEIEKFGHINLIVGKNSVGKTSLLEAINLFCTRFPPSIVLLMLEFRNESKRNKQDFDILSPLFYGRPNILLLPPTITIGSLSHLNTYMSFKLDCYLRNIGADNITNYSLIDENDIQNITQGFEYRLTVDHGLDLNQQHRIIKHYPLNKDAINQAYIPPPLYKSKIIFSYSTYVDKQLFYNIDLSSLKIQAIQFLQIINPDIIDFSLEVIDEKDMYFRVKIKDIEKPVPLSSLGDGVSRLLCIILHLLDCKNGVLLIDEIENGLHYSIQVEVWKMIFKIAKELNVQVFATTHSDDCVKAFGGTAIEDQEQQGLLLKLLHNRKNQIVCISADEEEIEFTHQKNIEVR